MGSGFEFGITYRALRGEIRGKRVAIVNDVINAGSAVRGTFADLKNCGAQPIAIGALAVLGQAASQFNADKKLTLETIAFLPNEVWTPSECPLCARGVPLADALGSNPSKPSD
jgi:orotate phosphoribosyltransferase